jgi:hypothetical protein
MKSSQVINHVRMEWISSFSLETVPPSSGIDWCLFYICMLLAHDAWAPCPRVGHLQNWGQSQVVIHHSVVTVSICLTWNKSGILASINSSMHGSYWLFMALLFWGILVAVFQNRLRVNQSQMVEARDSLQDRNSFHTDMADHLKRLVFIQSL